ncbi:hypothetical protein OPT61_g9889 [Boeremia exigua]|uniref:Uncharacterized protein n=1 Tax=Boeremia exigua TaxID=749465 RepID=A0ACC2HS65_9PLEO|nr:hypothetical protein OPT61_g9889 [Boeremia exigua]
MDPEGGLGPANAFVSEQNKTPTNSNYLAPWSIYAYDWCKWNVPAGNSAGKMAVGSYIEDNHNFIRILDTQIVPQHDAAPGASPYGLEYNAIAEATCSFPVTRILWEPPSSQKQSTDLLATSGDHLRLWSLPQSSGNNMSNTISRTSSVNTREPQLPKLTPLALLSNSKTPEHTAPLTSLDWNTMSPKLIITSSIDTTCTIWDIPTLTAKTQLIAHDKEVFDVRFCAGSVDVFVSCGADGSVRMFDLRSLEHSTIIYEPSDKTTDKDKGKSILIDKHTVLTTMSYAPPLLRLAASPHDSHLLATFAQDSNVVRILDVRQPGQALLELRGHSAALNSIEWNPSRRGMLASGGDDSLVLVWDLLHANNGAAISSEHAAPVQPVAAAPPANGTGAQSVPVGQKGPSVSWRCDYEVGNISWAPQSALTGQGGDWFKQRGDYICTESLRKSTMPMLPPAMIKPHSSTETKPNATIYAGSAPNPSLRMQNRTRDHAWQIEMRDRAAPLAARALPALNNPVQFNCSEKEQNQEPPRAMIGGKVEKNPRQADPEPTTGQQAFSRSGQHSKFGRR